MEKETAYLQPNVRDAAIEVWAVAWEHREERDNFREYTATP